MTLSVSSPFIRFCLIGTLATFVHIILANLILYLFASELTFANVIAYLCTFGLSFFANTFWSFSTLPSINRFKKYLLTSLFVLMVITSVSYIFEKMQVSNAIASVIIALVIALLNYLLQRHFVFSH